MNKKICSWLKIICRFYVVYVFNADDDKCNFDCVKIEKRKPERPHHQQKGKNTICFMQSQRRPIFMIEKNHFVTAIMLQHFQQHENII